MYIQLMYRYGNVQYPVKYRHVLCRFENVVAAPDQINESLLLQSIPAGWLPVSPKQILLTVANTRGSIGQKNLSIFRPWGRHFESYILELWNERPHRS